MTTFDLDAASTEVSEDWTFDFRGESFTIPGDLSLDVWFSLGTFARVALSDTGSADGLAQVAAMADLRDAARGLFRSEEDYDRFLSLRPTQAHLVALLSESSRRATGSGLGEASELSSSSADAADLSSPTSNGSTVSTSTPS